MHETILITHDCNVVDNGDDDDDDDNDDDFK
jgi:hypothetical protein